MRRESEPRENGRLSVGIDGPDKNRRKSTGDQHTKGSAPSRDKRRNNSVSDDGPDIDREMIEQEKQAAMKRKLLEAAAEELPFPGIPLYVADADKVKKMTPEEQDKNEWKYLSEIERQNAKGGNKDEEATGLGMELHASFAEDWNTKAERIRQSSSYKDEANWGN